MTTEITPPIELNASPGAAGERFTHRAVEIPSDVARRLATACPTAPLSTNAEASRDWWPLTMHWALAGDVPKSAALVCRPVDAGQVSVVLGICNENRIPVTTAGGRSGVCGAAIPLHGGVLLDTTAMRGVVSVDDASLTVEVLPGTFGPDLEAHLRPLGLTVGHFPQSFDIATVGGWVACRGAGQYSTRYG
ncbi:MAG: FAD-binding oxidoreductase, partial [Acidimicrobiia bacterium]